MSETIGYVVGDTEDAVTLCKGCDLAWDDDIPRTPIEDDAVYGEKIPYPECFLCEEVIRPHD